MSIYRAHTLERDRAGAHPLAAATVVAGAMVDEDGDSGLVADVVFEPQFANRTAAATSENARDVTGRPRGTPRRMRCVQTTISLVWSTGVIDV